MWRDEAESGGCGSCGGCGGCGSCGKSEERKGFTFKFVVVMVVVVEYNFVDDVVVGDFIVYGVDVVFIEYVNIIAFVFAFVIMKNIVVVDVVVDIFVFDDIVIIVVVGTRNMNRYKSVVEHYIRCCISPVRK